MSATIPQEVLVEALSEAIAGRPVRTAVFTTFSFDPGFFELHVLSALFDYPFSQVEKVRRVQLEDKLRSVRDLAVYYDRRALSQDALPAQLDFRRLDVRRGTGVFHPKLIMLLVENPPNEGGEEGEDDSATENGPLSLIIGSLSANLTRSGWWENVETGHFEEIRDKDWDDRPCSFRKDLLRIIRRVRDCAIPDEGHAALDAIHGFLLRRVSRREFTNHSAKGRYFTRLFVGQSDLPTWLTELRLSRFEWNLEIISPFFDAADGSTLESLLHALRPKETRIYLPVAADGEAQVTAGAFESIGELAYWSSLPVSVMHGGKKAYQEKAVPRRVHAKVYRLWSKHAGEIVLVGSVNLTSAGHSHGGAGNLEAAFLIHTTEKYSPHWWLQRIDVEPSFFTESQADETDETQPVPIDITLRFDWNTEALHYRIDGHTDGPLHIDEPSGRRLFTIKKPAAERWIDCGAEPARVIRQLLFSTSFLQVSHSKGTWRVLVREEGMIHRPSLLTSLTPEEILMYWSLLSADQQAAFIEEKLAADGTLAGPPVAGGKWFSTQDTVFDRFAGVYHAFERLHGHIVDAIKRGCVGDARARLFGAKYDSLPVLLAKVLEREDGDPVMRYVTFLCAKQEIKRVRHEQPDFWKTHGSEASGLRHLMKSLPSLRAAIPFESDDRDDFLAWYETMFLGEIEQVREVV
jgi:hypothetical protein